VPDEEPVDLTKEAKEWIIDIQEADSMDALKALYAEAYKELQKDKNAVQLIANAKDIRKVELS
jgi:DNA polymerase III delta prime subunit